MKLVVGVEIIAEAIEDAKLNSQLNGNYIFGPKKVYWIFKNRLIFKKI